MIILNLLNGPEGCQIGIEDGFQSLKDSGMISNVYNFYLKAHIDKKGLSDTLSTVYEMAKTLAVEVVIVYHLSNCHIPKDFFLKLKNLPSKPTLVYDEHDGYERFRKPFSQPMKTAISEAHIISLCGLGSIVKMIEKKHRPKVVYTPHHTTIQRFDLGWQPTLKRKYDVLLIGNKLTSRIPFKRLSGAKIRKDLVRQLGECFGDRFAVYGNGWEGFIGNKGPLDFEKQFDAIRESWLTVGVDHCTGMSYYFSDRLPISMCSGVAHICHYHIGYELLFKYANELLWFKAPNEAIDIIKVTLSKGTSHLITLGENGRKKALKSLTPTIVWGNLIKTIIKLRNK